MKKQRKSVALLYGGRGVEAEISRRSASAILSHFDTDRFLVHTVYIAKDGGFWYLPKARAPLPIGEAAVAEGVPTFPILFDGVSGLYLSSGILPIDLALPALHGDFGEDGRIVGLLDTARIPYVGEGVLTGAVGADKAYTKYIAGAIGIPTTPFAVLEVGEGAKEAMQKLSDRHLDFPIFFKPAGLGSSIGASLIENEAALGRAISEHGLCGRLLLEKYLSPVREIEVSVLKKEGTLQICPPAEIVSAHGFYDYEEKYSANTARITLTPHLDAEIEKTLFAYTAALCRALGVRMLSRLDFFLTESGEVYFNEINTFPGFTEISLFPKQTEALGLSFGALLTHLCEVAYAGDL